MANVWVAEVTVGPVAVAGPGPSAANTSELHKLEIDIEDDTGPNATVTLEWTMEVHSFGGGPTYEYRTRARLRTGGADTTNVAWGEGPAVATLTEADGLNGAAWLAGGRLAVTKDDNAQTLTMTTPLGTSTVSFVAAGLVVGGTFKGDGLYHRWDRPDLNADGQSSVGWSGFWTTKNGTRVSGAALGNNQPGDWFDNSVGDSPWFYGAVIGVRIARANGQTDTRLTSGWSYNDALDNPRATSSDEWRFWGNTGSIGEIPLVLDLCVNRQSGQIVVARVKKQTPERITISYTEDSGANWFETEVNAVIGSFCSPPTLGVTPDGAFSLVFHDSATAVYYRSETGGRTWEFVGTFVPVLPWLVSGRVPAHFQHPSGLLIVTYTTGGSFLYGLFNAATGASVAIATVTLAPGTANVYPAFLVLPLGGVVISWSDATTKTQTRSDNLITFTNDFTGAVSVERRPRHVTHPGMGLSLHLYQDTGDLKFYPSEDGGITVLHPPAVTVFAGAADQYADLDVTPIGLLLVVFQSYDAGTDSWELTAYGSDNLGTDWGAV